MDIDRRLSDFIMSHSRSMLSVINRNYIYERVNDRLCNAHTGKKCDIEGKRLDEVWGNHNFHQNIKPRIDRCLGGETIHYEARFETAERGLRYFDVTLRPFSEKDGVVTHLLAETIDITEIREAESTARQIEAEFKNLESILPVGFIRLAEDGTLIHLNQVCREILGLSDDVDPAGLNISEFYADRALFSLHAELLGENPSRPLGRARFNSVDGREITCRVSGFLARDEAGKVVHIDMAVEDITREQNLEDRLGLARKLETVGALAGGIAHDFNNILTTIFGYAEMSLADLPALSPLRNNLTRIISSVTRARVLTEQLLTFSRHIDQEKVPVDPETVIDETISFLNSTMPVGVTIEKRIDSEGRLVYADPIQLFRVFHNLVSNAFHAMEPDGGRLTISVSVRKFGEAGETRISYLKGEYAVISFSDTGTGIDKENIDRIFEPYFTTREVGKGSGLGLSVVHGIITELGGEIDVETTPGAGSTFSVIIPAIDPDGKSLIEMKPSVNLLVVSDNMVESRMLCMGLENSGYTIRYAMSAWELAGLLKDEIIHNDLILFIDDIPGFTPGDLHRVCEKMNISFPLILVTGQRDLISEERLLNSLPEVQVLFKPVSLREVRNAIEVVLNRR